MALLWPRDLCLYTHAELPPMRGQNCVLWAKLDVLIPVRPTLPAADGTAGHPLPHACAMFFTSCLLDMQRQVA